LQTLCYFSSAGYICQQNTIIAGSEHCEHARVSAGLVPLTLKFQFSRHISNFELTGDPFKLIMHLYFAKRQQRKTIKKII